MSAGAGFAIGMAVPAWRCRVERGPGFGPPPLAIAETGLFPYHVCAVCGTERCVVRVRRPIAPEDALDALHKTGLACWYDESYYCAGHAAMAAGVNAAPPAA